MRAAILRSYGSIPAIGEWPEPGGESLEVLAAGLNPVDLRIASGEFYAGVPDVPYVPGSEGVARTPAGERVYFRGGGAFAERVAAAETVPIPDGVDDGMALACGTPGCTALVALERGRMAAGERVLVLGASGSVGWLAVQLAVLRGAGSVVAAARDVERLGELEAVTGCTVVTLDSVAEAGPFDLVVDPLWGAPAAAASRALDRGGRLVALGESAGPAAAFTSADVRGRQLEILGLALPAVGPEVRRRAYERVVAHAASGELSAAYEELPLDDIATAWERQATGSPRTKLVLRP